MTANLVSIENKHLSLTISDMGAEMQNLYCNGHNILWNGDAEFWTGRAPILFPIVGRAPDDKIAIGNHEADMPQHGFARRSTFVLDEKTPEMCRHILRDNNATRQAYPYVFKLSVTHSIFDKVLSVQVEIENLNDCNMPFGFGFHPAFCWPLPNCETQVHEVILDNGTEPKMLRLEDGLLNDQLQASPFTEGSLEIRPNMFDQDAMIFPRGAGKGLTYGVKNGSQLKFRFNNLPNLALWSKPNAPFLCIEPWHGMAARVNGTRQISERPFSLELSAGDIATFGYQIELQL